MTALPAQHVLGSRSLASSPSSGQHLSSGKPLIASHLNSAELGSRNNNYAADLRDSLFWMVVGG